MTSLKTCLAATAALLAVAPGAANAVPYAFGAITFSNFALTGLISPGVTVNSATVSTSSSAVYNGVPDGASAFGDLATGSDVRESFAGPGIAPPQNTFTQVLSGSSGSRGDALLLGNISSGTASAGDVAEGRLLIDGATASSAGGTTTGVNLTITVTGPTLFGLSFTASDSLIATTSAADDGASAQVNASFSVTGAGYAGFTFSPDALNTSVSASGTGNSQTFSSGPLSYTTSVSLGAGTYQFSLLSGVQERLNAGPAAVREPASLALLGAGLVGLGVIRLRKHG